MNDPFLTNLESNEEKSTEKNNHSFSLLSRPVDYEHAKGDVTKMEI